MEKTLTKAIKTICCSLTGVLTISGAPQQLYAENASLPYWKDIQTVSVNRETPRSAFMTYADKTQALTGKYENSPYYELLNGTWKFLLYGLVFEPACRHYFSGSEYRGMARY